MRKRLAKKIKAKKEAELLIPELLKRSVIEYKKGNKPLSEVYSKKIRHLCMKHKIRLPNPIKKQLCRNCYGILIPSLNCRVRIREGKLVTYCLDCKKYMRVPLKD